MAPTPRTAPSLLAALTLLALARAASAHPLGLASVNRYAGVKLHEREVEVDYLIDYAEIPAWTEIETLDADHDGAVTAQERDRYVADFLSRMLPTLDVRVDGRRLTLREAGHGVEAPPGQGNLSTLRVAIELRAPLPEGTGERCTVAIREPHLAGRGGWRELAADDSPAGRLVSSSLPVSPRAGAGLAYPEGPARAAMPRHDEATFVFDRRGGGTAGGAGLDGLARGGRGARSPEVERLVAVLRDPQRSPGFVLFALALAFALGAGHALSPGHGKTIVGAWLVGARAKPRHALVLAASVTVTHTASVFLLWALAYAVERHVGTERLLRALELTSGALVVGIALSQLPGRLRRMRGLDVPHDHDHDHSHDHGHSHAPPEGISLRGLVALGVSGGVVPCLGALVVLLTAVSMRRAAFGFALLVAFSLGLATVLSAVGLASVLARSRLERFSTDGRLFRALPVASSCAVLALGVAIVVKALLP